MFYEEICEAGLTLEIRRYYSPYARPRGAPRAKKKNPTSEEQFKENERQAEIKLRRLLNCNFGEGDYHLVLDYRPNERPNGKKELQDDFSHFIRKLRRDCKKLGIEIKYIHVYEIGKRGALHHHLVINKVDTGMIQAAWKKGRIRVSPLDDTGQYSELASYLIKYSSVMMKNKEDWLQGKRWIPSRNLEKPKIKKKKIFRNIFKEEPRERKGYYIDKNLSYCFVDANGYKNMQTVYVRIRGKESGG